MIAKAEGKFLRISPSKVRQVIDLIQKAPVLEAENILANLNKRPKEHLIKLLKSAVANARVKGLEAGQLYISKLVCNPGPSWKRYRPAAFGRATPIKKRTSHIKIELDLRT